MCPILDSRTAASRSAKQTLERLPRARDAQLSRTRPHLTRQLGHSLPTFGSSSTSAGYRDNRQSRLSRSLGARGGQLDVVQARARNEERQRRGVGSRKAPRRLQVAQRQSHRRRRRDGAVGRGSGAPARRATLRLLPAVGRAELPGRRCAHFDALPPLQPRSQGRRPWPLRTYGKRGTQSMRSPGGRPSGTWQAPAAPSVAGSRARLRHLRGCSSGAVMRDMLSKRRRSSIRDSSGSGAGDGGNSGTLHTHQRAAVCRAMNARA
eukprot:364890-Chlamydomonas_euryale.AAC.1